MTLFCDRLSEKTRAQVLLKLLSPVTFYRHKRSIHSVPFIRFYISLNNLTMHQAFTRIEAGDQNYYLLTNSFDGGKNGFDLTVCNGEQVWRETGMVITVPCRNFLAMLAMSAAFFWVSSYLSSLKIAFTLMYYNVLSRGLHMKWAGKLFGNLNENPKRQSERDTTSFFLP